ncbi:MAG: isochorismatase family protein [Methylococcus sp.]|nr:isochorismatase family protein [Methylococcus sp.]
MIAVHVQNDFLPGGGLAVPDSAAIVPVLNDYIVLFVRQGLPVIATRDWHPPHHCSFRQQGGPWPSHCVGGSSGAEFSSGLALPENAWVVSQATRPDKEAYSSFEDTDLALILHDLGIRRLFIGGLAADYCVLNTVLDARRLGFDVVVLEDAVRAIDADSGDGRRSLHRMQAQGARFAVLKDFA